MPSSKGDQSAVVAFSGGIGVITATVDAGLIDRGDLTS